MGGYYDPFYGVPGPAGPAGAPGTNGRTVLSGVVPPVPALGADGDFYIDTAASLLYGPKAAGAWPAGVDLHGAAGAAGADATIATVRDEGVALAARGNLNFVGTGVTATDDVGNNATVVTIPGGAGHAVQDEGVALTARANLNFVGAGVTATDDAGNNATVVTIPGGSADAIGQGAAFPAFDPGPAGIAIADDGVTNYEFPSLCLADNGDLLMGCRHGLDSNLYDSGDAVLFRSTTKGRTWDAGTVIATHATYDVGSLSLTKLSSGRIVGVIWYGELSPSFLSVSVWSLYSDDHGVTWSAPAQVNTGAYIEPSSFSHVFQRTDGSVLLPYWAWSAHATNPQQRLARSTDNGATFADYALIALDATATKLYSECSIVRLAGGNLRAFLLDYSNDIGGTDWPAPGGPSLKRWVYCDSADEGATWGGLTQAFHANSHPEVIRTAGGKFVAAIGRRDSDVDFVYLPCVRTSEDGTTWTTDADEITLDASITGDSPVNTTIYGTYSDVIEISPGVLVFAYSAMVWATAGTGACYAFIRMKYLILGGGVAPDGTAAAKGLTVRGGNIELLAGAAIRYRDAEGKTVFGPGAMPNTVQGLIGKNNAANPNDQADFSADIVAFDDGSILALPSRTVDVTVSGVNGRDAGNEAANTWYHVWAIAKPDNTINLLLSISATAPVLPSGYTRKSRIGAIRNNGSSNFFTFAQVDRAVSMFYRIVSAGTAAVLTEVDLTAAIPATARYIRGKVILFGTADTALSCLIKPTSPDDDVGANVLQTTLTVGNLTNMALGYALAVVTAQRFWYAITAPTDSVYIDVCEYHL